MQLLVDQLAGHSPDVQYKMLRPEKPWSPSGASVASASKAARVVQRQEEPSAMSPEDLAAYLESAREQLNTHRRAAVNRRLHDVHDPAIVERAEQRFSGDLPELTGVGSEIIMTSFVQAILQLQRDWSKLTVEKRGNRIYLAANQALRDAGAWELYDLYVEDISTPAHFSPDTWTVTVGRAYMTSDSLTDEAAAKLADIGLHETRHCEQFFRAYRWLAGYGATLDAMLEQNPSDVPEEVIEKAHEKPLDLSTGSQTEVDESHEWFIALIHDADEAQEPIGDLLGVISDLLAQWDLAKAALDAFEADPTSDNQDTFEEELDEVLALAQDYEEVYARYRQIVDEADAFEVGVSASTLFSRMRAEVGP